MPLRDLAPFKTPRRAAASQTAGLANVPAPVGGLNLRDPISEMAPTDAVVLDNMIPRNNGVQMRKGYQLHVDDVGHEIKTLMSYTAPNPNDNKLFACANGNIYDVTTDPATVAVSATGSTYNQWWWTQFTTPADTFLLAVSPGAGYYTYSTASGWTLRTPSGLPTTTLRTVGVWKQRLFFTSEESADLYYLQSVNSITANAASFHMGSLLRNGGYISAMFNWTLDAGVGIDDHLVVVGTQGDVGVWQGTDPSSSTNFTLRGVWYIGPVPKYGRYFSSTGGDVLVLSELGLIQMSKLVNGQFVDADPGPVQKIQTTLSPIVTSLKDTQSWDVFVAPSDDVLVIRPPKQPTGVYQQFGMNINTGSWCTFSNMSMDCAAVLDGVTYFGTAAGNVYKGFYGPRDNVAIAGTGGDLIEADIQTSFQSFGTPGLLKKFGMARPVFIANTAPAVKVRMNVQYAFTDVAGSPNYTLSSDSTWDTGLWNTAIWAGSENTYQAFAGVAGLGYMGSLRMKVRGVSGTIFSSTHVLIEQGGVM